MVIPYDSNICQNIVGNSNKFKCRASNLNMMRLWAKMYVFCTLVTYTHTHYDFVFSSGFWYTNNGLTKNQKHKQFALIASTIRSKLTITFRNNRRKKIYSIQEKCKKLCDFEETQNRYIKQNGSLAGIYVPSSAEWISLKSLAVLGSQL